MKLLITLVPFLLGLVCYCQPPTYYQLATDFFDALNRKDSLECERLANDYFDKATDENRTHYKIYAYYLHSQKFISFKEKAAYLEKGIALAKEKNDVKNLKFILANASAIYFDQGAIKKSLDCAIEASRIKEGKSYDLSILHNLGNIYERLEQYTKASECYEKVISLEQDNIIDTLGHVITLNGLFNVQLELNEIDKVTDIQQKMVGFATDEKQKVFSLLSSAIIDFHQNNFEKSKSTLNHLIDSQDIYFGFSETKIPMIRTLHYRSKIFTLEGKRLKALNDLIRIDSLSRKINYVHPQMHNVIKSIVSHFKETGNTKKQIHYLNHLIHLDSILTEGYKDLNNSIVNKLDIAQLVKEKQQLKRKHQYGVVTTLILGLFVIVLVFYFYRFKKRVKLKQLQKQNALNAQIKPIKPKDESLPDSLVSRLSNHLVEFEKNHSYLDPTLTLGSLAKSFDTNEKYLSKVIKIKSEKKFTHYITDLRIDYAVTNIHKLSMYSVKSIALECGFNSPNVFSRAFKEKTGVYPSEFLRNLNSTDQD